MIPSTAELQIAAEFLLGSTKRVRKKKKALQTTVSHFSFLKQLPRLVSQKHKSSCPESNVDGAGHLRRANFIMLISENSTRDREPGGLFQSP